MSISKALVSAARRRNSAGAIFDDFSNDLSNWTVQHASWAISAGEISSSNVSYERAYITHNTVLASNQYVKVRQIAGSNFPQIVLRFTDISSPFYTFEFRPDGDIGFIRWNNTDGGAAIGSYQTTAARSDVVIGVTLTGTDDDVILRMWLDPVANAPTSNGTLWDGDAPDYSYTTNHTAVNTGGLVGLAAYQSGADAIKWDDFHAGSIS